MVQHVLMIEDDARLAGMVATYLAPHGLQVTHAASAGEGMGMLRQDERAFAPGFAPGFALVLLDLMLPDADGLEVCRQIRALTAHQFDLLVALAERAGRVLSREQLLDAVGGRAFDPFDRSIDVHIGRLRVAIEDDARQPRRIITVRGAGYVFARVQDA
jgi:DNA-binding response OmpR family regulator